MSESALAPEVDVQRGGPPGIARVAGWRFLFCYLVLYLAPFPFDSLPGIGNAAEALGHRLGMAVVPWVGARVFGMAVVDPYPVNGGNGSGDPLYEYIRLFILAVLALAASLSWLSLDRRDRHSARLREWLEVAIRYYLAIAMLSYGLEKVFKMQFLFPEPAHLFQPLGQMTPMRLLWSFMGYSTPYTVFCGLAEVVGGLLMFSRQTSALGALVVVGVMSNVVMLNLCYDVPVKTYSSHLLFMALLLLAPEARRLSQVFVLNRAAAPRELAPHFRTRRWNRTAAVAKGLFIAWVLFDIGKIVGGMWLAHGARVPQRELYGAYEVESFEPRLENARRWRRFFVNRSTFTVQRMDDRMEPYPGKTDVNAGTLSLNRGSERFVLSYRRPAGDRLILDGVFEEGARIHVELRQLDLGELPLLKRGFHWVNEKPNN